MEIYGQIRELLVEITREGVRETIPFPFGAVIIRLINIVSEDHSAIARLEQKLEQLINQPYELGRMYLEAAQHEPTKTSQEKYVNLALQEFMKATLIKSPKDPILPIRFNAYVAVCHDLLAEKENALLRYEKTHELLVSYIRSQEPSRQTMKSLREITIAQLQSSLSRLSRLDKLDKEGNLSFGLDDYDLRFLRDYSARRKWQNSTGFGGSLNQRFVPPQRPLRLRDNVRRLLPTSQPSREQQEPEQKERIRKRELERNDILEKLTKLKNSPASMDDLFDPAKYDAQIRSESLDAFAKQGYFRGWKMDEQKARDICGWAIDLTNMIASRGLKRLKAS